MNSIDSLISDNSVPFKSKILYTSSREYTSIKGWFLKGNQLIIKNVDNLVFAICKAVVSGSFFNLLWKVPVFWTRRLPESYGHQCFVSFFGLLVPLRCIVFSIPGLFAILFAALMKNHNNLQRMLWIWPENGLVISNSVELELYIKRNETSSNVSRQHKSYFNDQIKISRYLQFRGFLRFK